MNTELPEGVTRTFVRTGPGNFELEWNRAVREFLERGDDWLFSTHSDVVYEPGTLTRLLSWKQPLVAALVFMRQSPVVPHIWRTYEGSNVQYAFRVRDTRDWFYAHREYIRFGPFIMDPRPADALAPVGFTSTSCILIHRHVLEAIEPPWFVWQKNEQGYPVGGEDRMFFEKAAAMGYTGYVDRSCVAGHLVGDIPTSSAEFIAWEAVSEFRDTGEPVLEAA
jgi:hypothetical protein